MPSDLNYKIYYVRTNYDYVALSKGNKEVKDVGVKQEELKWLINFWIMETQTLSLFESIT